MTGKDLKVGIGDMKFARGEGQIITYALGSCIGITMYDPAIRLGGAFTYHAAVKDGSKGPEDIQICRQRASGDDS